MPTDCCGPDGAGESAAGLPNAAQIPAALRSMPPAPALSPSAKVERASLPCCFPTPASSPLCWTTRAAITADPIGCGLRARTYRSIVLVKGVVSPSFPRWPAWTTGRCPGLGVRAAVTYSPALWRLLSRGADPLAALVGVSASREAGAHWQEHGLSDSSPARSPAKCPRYCRAEPCWRVALKPSPIRRTTWMTLVDPAVPNGTPAISTTRSPPSAMR